MARTVENSKLQHQIDKNDVVYIESCQSIRNSLVCFENTMQMDNVDGILPENLSSPLRKSDVRNIALPELLVSYGKEGNIYRKFYNVYHMSKTLKRQESNGSFKCFHWQDD